MPSPSHATAIERLRPYYERARSSTGWRFSDLTVRHLGPPLPWDYPALVRERARKARSVLDLGTGGGEVLSELRDSLPPTVVATEEWGPNAPVANRRLRPLGVAVVRCRSLQLPFADTTFDLVIDRHEELAPREVARVLQPAGCAITQQVGTDNWGELRRYFPRMTDFGDLHGEYARGLAVAGLEVTTDREHHYKVAFGSLGDVVFMLTVAPWTVPGFALERDIEALVALDGECRTEDGIVLTESRYLLVAEKVGT